MTLMQEQSTERTATTVAVGETSQISPASLTAYALAKRGFSVQIYLRNDQPALTLASANTFTIYLRRPVPVPTLLAMLRRAQKSPNDALLLFHREVRNNAYAEQLHATEGDELLRIERKFLPTRHRDTLGSCVGVVARAAPGPAERMSIARILRRTLIGGGAIATAHIHSPLFSDDADALEHLLSFLTSGELSDVAERIGYRTVGPQVFAHPKAHLHPNAVLRGPLFIDPDVVLTAEDIHIGPGWIQKGSPPITIARTKAAQQARLGTSDVSPLPSDAYFIGPRLQQRPGYELAKRAFDLCFALLMLVATSPICFVVAVIIKMYDKGPVLFVHTREGKNGKPFGCVKFRTMVVNAEAIKHKLRAENQNQVDGPQFKIAKDPRITPFGRFLRKTNIDELPQFWNVLTGDMSIVGPRPSPYEENQLCPPWREARLSVRPGITGLWQVSRSDDRGPADFQEWIHFDTRYVEQRSFWLDLRIVLLTVKEVLGKGQ